MPLMEPEDAVVNSTRGIHDRKEHWDRIYRTKELTEVSWFQPVPQVSVDFIKDYNLPINAQIIDIGGGDSMLVDHLLDMGYSNISVLDISEAALEKAKQRLGARAEQVKWITTDVITFKPIEQYDLWHDRATFHFLSDEGEIRSYLDTAHESLVQGGMLLLGTFSEQGPDRCSSLRVTQYSEQTMTDLLMPRFEKLRCITTDHRTPFGTTQNFVFCSFSKQGG